MFKSNRELFKCFNEGYGFMIIFKFENFECRNGEFIGRGKSGFRRLINILEDRWR